MAAIQVTFYYDPKPEYYEQTGKPITLNEMVDDDVESLENGDLHILGLADISYRIEYHGLPHIQ